MTVTVQYNFSCPFHGGIRGEKDVDVANVEGVKNVGKKARNDDFLRAI